MEATLQELERYYDTVPRLSARAEDFGPLTLFVRDNGGHPFYARPTLSAQEAVAAQNIEAVRARQRELGIPETFEWVHEISPGLTEAAREAGLEVASCPLLVLPPDAEVSPPTAPVQFLTADSPALGAAIAVQRLSFSGKDTDLADEVAAATADGTIERAQAQLRSSATYFCAALDPDGNPLSAGQHNPVGDVTEIVALPPCPPPGVAVWAPPSLPH